MTDPATLFHRLYDRTPIGVEEDVLERAEQRLGLLLPPPLRALHLACGREASVMSAHNRFLSPDALDLADGRLIFCEENQTVCVWGCVPGGEDPEAEIANVLPDGALEWHSEQVPLSELLAIMVYLQTAWGGFPHAADLHAIERALPTIEAEWDPVVRHNGLTIYEKPGLLISSLEGSGFLTAAARTPDGIASLQRELGFSPM